MVTKKELKKDTKYVKKTLRGNNDLATKFAFQVVINMMKYGPENGEKAWHKATKKLRKVNKRDDVDNIISSWGTPREEPVIEKGTL